MTERMIEVNGVELCTEPSGDPVDRPILLIQGVAASMLWWDERFCRTLSESGCFVIRYDHRDTGRSIPYERAHPGYTGADLVADPVGVLDAYGIPRATSSAFQRAGRSRNYSRSSSPSASSRWF